MDLSVYSRRQTYHHPVFRTREVVGVAAVFWALLSGPFYYWKKGARIEAILLALSSIPLFMFDADSALISYSTLSDLTTLVWFVAVAGAPVLLAASYRRRGWVEMGKAGEVPEEDEDDGFARQARRRPSDRPIL